MHFRPFGCTLPVLLFLLQTSACGAADFDCANARSTLDFAICDSREAMAANDRHTAAWKDAIARTTQEEKVSLLVDQRAWNKRLAVECEATGRVKPNPEQMPRMVRCIVSKIEDRIAFLEK